MHLHLKNQVAHAVRIRDSWLAKLSIHFPTHFTRRAHKYPVTLISSGGVQVSSSQANLVKKSIGKTEVGHGVGGPDLPCAERGLHTGAIAVVYEVIIVESIWMQERRREAKHNTQYISLKMWVCTQLAHVHVNIYTIVVRY